MIWQLRRCMVAALLLSIPASARADPAAVRVVASGPGSATADLEVVVRELLSRLPIRLDWSLAPAIDPREIFKDLTVDAGVVAYVWLDLGDATRAAIYVGNSNKDRFLLRAVPLANGYDEVARESIAHIVESAVDALLSGDTIGVSREVAEREVATAVVAPSPSPLPLPAPRKRQIEVAAFYRLAAAGPYALLQGPEVAVVVDFLFRRVAVPLFISVHYDAPVTWYASGVGPTFTGDPRLGNANGVGARFDGGGARLGAGIEAQLGSRVRLRFVGGAGVDLQRVAPRAQPGVSVALNAAFWVAVPIVTAAAQLQVRLWRALNLQAGLACDVDVVGQRYQVIDGAMHRTVLEPWRFRPVMQLGLVLRFGR